jgi:4-diphosphocytidyl-2-C-methyl-D-erythritol kinase
LVAANRLWQLHWPRWRLAEVAAELGSDVPFFLQDGPAVCRGRGELLQAVPLGARLHVAVVRPPAGLSTAEVYRHCRPAKSPWGLEGLLEAAQRGQTAAVGRALFNGLQAAAEELSPWIGRVRAAFRRTDCCGHQMSGSGTSYFGI